MPANNILETVTNYLTTHADYTVYQRGGCIDVIHCSVGVSNHIMSMEDSVMWLATIPR